MRLLALAATVLVAGLAFSAAASNAAGPRYILVHGGGLAAPVLLDDLAANELLISAPEVEPRTGVPRSADRPVFELALFFIVPDLAGRSPADLRPDETGAVGRFFPAVGDLEAIFEVGAVPGIGPRRDGGLTPPMLDYLVAFGIPIVSNAVLGPEQPTPTPAAVVEPGLPDDGDGGGLPGWASWTLGSAGLVAVAAVAFALRRTRRRPRRRGVHF